MGKRDDLGDIRRGPGGGYVYTGESYRVADGSQKSFRLSVLTLFLSAAFVVSAGLVRFPGMMNAFYVILPYVGAVCCVFAAAWRMVKLLVTASSVRSYVLKRARSGLPLSAYALCAMSGLGLVCSAVFCILNGTGSPVFCAAFFAVTAAYGVSGFLCARSFGKVVWEKTR
ncbi:MAG: hypothetical protein K6C36_07665 [Clostridia bacterium]|nr:hypothetical protein [Clostridia bacterium]